MLATNPLEFGAMVRERRTRLGLTQAALAHAAGVSRAWVVGLERGALRAEFGKVMAVAWALGVGLSLEPLDGEPDGRA